MKEVREANDTTEPKPKTSTRKPKKRGKQTVVVQTHHISYQPEWTVRLYKGEHFLLTRMSWRKRVSHGFLTALEAYIRQHQHTAIHLHKE